MTDPYVVDLTDADFWQDPYPTWAEARRHGRTAVTQAGEPILLNADDLDVVASQPVFEQLGVSALERLGVTDGPLYEWRALTVAAVDGADHERLRSVVARAFAPRRVDVLRAELLDRARALLDAAAADGTFDVVATYASDLPLWLVCRFIGLPEADYLEIGAFIVGTEEGFTEPLTVDRRHRAEAGIVALYDYVDALVEDRARSPREDLVTDLLDGERRGLLSRDELRALVVNIIGGAIGSTRAAIANSTFLLLSHREQARWVRDDLGRLRGAVEECLRYAPPFRAGRRRVVEDVDRFDLDLTAGDTLYIARPAANRDPARWDEPERFDVSRSERRHHSFGHGPHLCLGQALARMDIQVAVQAILERVDGLELLIDEPRRVPFTPDEQLEALPVAVTRR